jgi:hypothetical protein
LHPWLLLARPLLGLSPFFPPITEWILSYHLPLQSIK